MPMITPLQRPRAARGPGWTRSRVALTGALAAWPAPTKQRAVLLVDLAASHSRGDINEAARLLGISIRSWWP